MLTIVIWFLISAVLSAFIGFLFSIGMRSDSDDMEQVEYLSRWSDMKRLRKSGDGLVQSLPEPTRTRRYPWPPGKRKTQARTLTNPIVN